MNRIIIKNFISLKKVDMKLNDFTILIGPQASGKSLIAKCVYVLRSFPKTLLKAINSGGNIPEIKKAIIFEFEEIFPRYSWGKKNFKIVYLTELGYWGLSYSSKNNLDFIYSDYYAELIQKATVLGQRYHKKQMDETIGERLRQQFKKLEFGFSTINEGLVYIPSGRSFFSILANNVFALLTENVDIDPFMKRFGINYSIARRIMNGHISPLLHETMQQVINGTYQIDRRQNKEWITSLDGRKTELVHTSSGQQEALPMLLVLFYALEYEMHALYFVEEPEAHLFPKAQKQIIKAIAEIYNTSNGKSSYFITTHSPYILSVFNLLLKAGMLQGNKRVKKTELNKIIPKKQQIIPQKLSAYLIAQETCTSVIDQETGLIDDQFIDAVSEETSTDFGKLLDLEFSNGQ